VYHLPSTVRQYMIPTLSKKGHILTVAL
jgi:hypothetical protein